MLIRYLKTKLPGAAVLLLFSGVFALVFALCGLPLNAVGYALLICAALGIAILAVDYVHFCSRCALLVKTPTAAAEWLIDRMQGADMLLRQLRDRVAASVKQRLEIERQAVRNIVHVYKFVSERVRQQERLRLYGVKQALMTSVTDYIESGTYRVGSLSRELPSLLKWALAEQKLPLARLSDALKAQLSRCIGAERERLNRAERTIELVSPERLLEKGYTLTLKGGKVVKSAAEIAPGDILCTWLADGKVESKVIK